MSNTKPRILMVDDDQALSDLFRSRFELEGFEVEHVADGESSLKVAENFQPDLILLDIMLPKLSGLDVLSQMRKTPHTKSVKIVMFTALGQKEDRQQAISLGANDYWVKSELSLAELIEKIRELVNAAV